MMEGRVDWETHTIQINGTAHPLRDTAFPP